MPNNKPARPSQRAHKVHRSLPSRRVLVTILLLLLGGIAITLGLTLFKKKENFDSINNIACPYDPTTEIYKYDNKEWKYLKGYDKIFDKSCPGYTDCKIKVCHYALKDSCSVKALNKQFRKNRFSPLNYCCGQVMKNESREMCDVSGKSLKVYKYNYSPAVDHINVNGALYSNNENNRCYGEYGLSRDATNFVNVSPSLIGSGIETEASCPVKV